jgi:Tfp pilus assembly protein PilF
MPTADELYDAAEKLKDAGKYDEAIATLTQALEQDPSHALTHLALAVLYGKVGQHEKAVEHGKRACEIDPSDAFSYTALSVTYQRAFAGTQNHHYIRLAEDAKAKAQMLQGHSH